MRTIATLTLLATLTIAPVARAQDDDPARVAAARALFQEGVTLARRGEYADATDRFRRAHALRPSAPIELNLASALVHQGALVEASEIFERILRDPSLPRAIRAQAERLRDELAPRLARLTVRLEGDASDVRVELDSRELEQAALGVALPIDPGAHEVRALRDGADVAVDRVELAEGERGELVLTIPARDEVPREALVVAPPAESPARTTGRDAPEPQGGDDGVVIVLGIVGALAVAGAVTAVAVVLTTEQTPTPFSGNAMPGVLTW